MDESIRPRKPTDPPPVDQATQLTEAQRLAMDVSYADLKAHGYLHRIEANRALALQIDRQGAANFTTTGIRG